MSTLNIGSSIAISIGICQWLCLYTLKICKMSLKTKIPNFRNFYTNMTKMGALRALEPFLKFFDHIVNFYEHIEIWVIYCYFYRHLPMALALYIKNMQNELKNKNSQFSKFLCKYDEDGCIECIGTVFKIFRSYSSLL